MSPILKNTDNHNRLLDGMFVCSNCGRVEDFDQIECPNCGSTNITLNPGES